MRRVEDKAQDMEAPAINYSFFNGNNLKFTLSFAHKINTSFGTVKGFICVHSQYQQSVVAFIKENNAALSAVSILNRSASQK